MKAYAIIPARGGSKRVKGKNLRTVGGVSLVVRAIEAATGAGVTPWLSTDDTSIVEAAIGGPLTPEAMDAWERGVGMLATSRGALGVHCRPPQLATDHAQIESALSHWYTRLDDKPDKIVLLQPTSPFRTAEHVREALRLLEVTGADSVVGVTVGHEHHFAGRLKPRESDAYGEAVGEAFYDWAPFRDVTADRPRTQDLRPMGAENGALYAFTRAHWERTGNRMGGHMVALPMTRWEGLDVDDEQDLAVCNALVAAGVCR